MAVGWNGAPMAAALPLPLSRLLDASDGATREQAWGEFVAEHSRLLIRVARSVNADHDALMDAYAHVLERLRAEDYRRLREYAPDGRTKFTTWLVVVARRLCLDWFRRRYGRPAPAAVSADPAGQRRTRRRLVDLIGGADPDQIAAPAATPSVERDEVRGALATVTARLSPDDRLLLKLRFDDGLSAPEIARLLDLPTPFHVYRRLNTLLAELRRSLRGLGIEGAEL